MKRFKMLSILILAGILLLSVAEADSINYHSGQKMLTIECSHAAPGETVSFMAIRGKKDEYSIAPETVHFLRQLTADSQGEICISFIGTLTEDYVFLLGGASIGEEPHMIGSFGPSGTERFTMPALLTTIEEEAFMGNLHLKAVVLGKEVQEIGNRAFKDCKNLYYLEIPASVTQIAPDALDGCEGITVGCTEGSEAYRYAEERNLPILLINQ